MVERSLSMREVPGSMPGSSTFSTQEIIFIFLFESKELLPVGNIVQLVYTTSFPYKVVPFY